MADRSTQIRVETAHGAEQDTESPVLPTISNEPLALPETVSALRRARSKDRGASMVEYALLVALIALVAVVAVRSMGQGVSGRFSSYASMF
jgi:Flp pilus assembly pilin Flp